MHKFDVTPVAPDTNFGVRITGLTSAMLKDDGVKRELNQLFTQHGLIQVKGLSSNEEQVEFSKAFGPLKIHPVPTIPRPAGFPELIEVGTHTGVRIAEIDGELLQGWLPWHFDHCYNDVLNRGGVLRSMELPKGPGGETGFIDRLTAYEILPGHLKERIENLNVIYWLDMNRENQRFGRRANVRVVNPADEAGVYAMGDTFPRAIHPMVFKKPDDGRKVLGISPWMAEGIEGMENEEGGALLEEVIDHMLNDNKPYFHKWADGDMLAWDNFRLLHCATGVAPGQTRKMLRSTIEGNYTYGRFEKGAKGHQALEREV